MASFSTLLNHCVFATCTFMYCGFILTCLASNIKEILFTSQSEHVSGFRTTVLTKHSAKFRTACALLCAEDDSCISFSFDKGNMLCKLCNRVLAPGPTVAVYTLKTECPADLEYKLYRYKGDLLCIKIVSTKIYQQTAERNCNNDGGHLLSIANANMHMLVKDVLKSIKSGTCWVDGKDLYNNDTMISWTGNAIPYVVWADGDPNGGGQECLDISTKNFDFRDAVCHDTFGYICQI